MTEDDVERNLSAPLVPEGAPSAPRGKRQRAADLFSPHRYRALQLGMFERRAGKASVAGGEALPVDDVADPLLSSHAPAAEAARAHMHGMERHQPFDALSPVDEPMDEADGEPFPFPFDPHDAVVDEELDDSAEYNDVDLNDSGASDGAADWLETADGADDSLEASPHPVTAAQERLEAIAAGGWSSADGVQRRASDVAAGGEDARVARPSSGRNMPVATVVGLALLAVTVGAAVLHPYAFAALLYTFAVGAVIEWKRALERHGRRIPVVPVIAASIGLGVATNFAQAEGLVVALLVGCAGVVGWRIGDERIENTLADSLAGVLTLLWIPFLASFLFLLELADDGWQRVIIVVLAVVGNDTGGLVSGVLFGRHKLLPRVSPAKTWEGAVGGLLLGTAAATVAGYFFFDGEWYIGTAVGAACAIAAVIGDLAESALKRDIQVKDMSTALPGHGGILDRIDSLLFAAPVGYVVFAIFLGTLGGGGL